MRPGSPVRPLARQLNDLLDSIDDQQPVPAAAVRTVETVVAPATVWVAVAVWTKAVAVNVNRAAVTAPLGSQGVGRAGVFANTPAAQQIQESFAAEVIAVALTQAECDQAVAAHREQHGDQACDYKIGEHPLGVVDAAGPGLGKGDRAPVAAACIGCGTVLHDGTVYCAKCRQDMFKQAKETDPGDVEPARRNTYTPPQDRTGRGSGM